MPTFLSGTCFLVKLFFPFFSGGPRPKALSRRVLTRILLSLIILGMATSIRFHRDRLGLSRPQLARRAGLPERTIERLEAGKNAPSVRVLLALSEALGVSTDALLQEPEDVSA